MKISQRPKPSASQIYQRLGGKRGKKRKTKRLRNQRPTLIVPPNVSTSVKEILIGYVLLLETLLVKFLPAPEPFQRKDALGWVWGFLYIYL